MTPQFEQTFAKPFYLFRDFVQHDVSHPFTADFSILLEQKVQRRNKSGSTFSLPAPLEYSISSD
jgi:hypothetical protein